MLVFNYPYSKLPLYGSYTALDKTRHLNGATDSTRSYFIFLIKLFQFYSSHWWDMKSVAKILFKKNQIYIKDFL